MVRRLGDAGGAVLLARRRRAEGARGAGRRRAAGAGLSGALLLADRRRRGRPARPAASAGRPADRGLRPGRGAGAGRLGRRLDVLAGDRVRAHDGDGLGVQLPGARRAALRRGRQEPAAGGHGRHAGPVHRAGHRPATRGLGSLRGEPDGPGAREHALPGRSPGVRSDPAKHLLRARGAQSPFEPRSSSRAFARSPARPSCVRSGFWWWRSACSSSGPTSWCSRS